MDAIVLVGGQGTRLRPLTFSRHKSLVPVCNRPAISYLFEWLARGGMERTVLAIGQHNEDLAEAYPTGKVAGIDLVQVTEKARLESGGAIRNAVREAGVEGRFVVVNGDLYVDFDLQDALRFHEDRDATLTLALHEVANPSQFGVAVVDDDGFVTGFVEKPPPGTEPGNLINAGVWIFEPGLVDEIPPGAVRVEETLFPSLVARRRAVLGYRFAGAWADIGTPARYLDLNIQLLAAGHSNAPGNVHLADGVHLAAGSRVEQSAIGPRTRTGEGAAIERSVLWEDVTVGRDATISGSILANGVTIGAGATVDAVVAGAGAEVGPGVTVPNGTVLEPGQRYHGDP